MAVEVKAMKCSKPDKSVQNPTNRCSKPHFLSKKERLTFFIFHILPAFPNFATTALPLLASLICRKIADIGACTQAKNVWHLVCDVWEVENRERVHQSPIIVKIWKVELKTC